MSQPISKKELNLLVSTSKVMLLDVRSATEFNEFHIPTAINVPLEQIEKGTFQPEAYICIITICATGGGRSKRAANILAKQFNNPVYYLDGGTYNWFEISQATY
ncbi:MAG: rhodanese-like domain-containing protein [Chitinophagaceae bacterium]